LDNEKWSKDRFDEIVAKLRVFLKQAGYKESDISYIPCSGLTGENLVKPASEADLISWYSGCTLLDIVGKFTFNNFMLQISKSMTHTLFLDHFKTPERSIDKPFRMSISDVYKGTSSGFCLSGRIESGHVCVNDKVLVCPSKEAGQVKNITIDEMPVNTAFAGDQVSVTLSNVDVNNISVGSIISEIAHSIRLATRIQARIIVFNVKTPITLGFQVLVHHQSLIEPATVSKLKAQLHKTTGEVIKKSPRCLGNNSCASVELTFQRAIPIEKYADIKELGRVMLRVGGITIAAGLVTDVISS
jgi:elongation factor 1 alpha-like protein